MALALGALVLAYAVTLAATPLTTRVAHRFGILDRPDVEGSGYKNHLHAMPYLGGVAIFLGVLSTAGLLSVEHWPAADHEIPRFLVAIGIAVGLGLVGLIDDVRRLTLVARLVAGIGAAVAAWELGFRVQAFPSASLNFALTVVWIVGITNAFNLLDNMDGLSAGLAGIGASSFAVMGFLEGQPQPTIVAAALAGGAFAFLTHNRHPAKVFMGDAGSLFLGFLLALIGIELRFDNLLKVTFLVPVVVLGVPIFDTTIVVLSRVKNRRPIFRGARDHVSHRLVRMGLPIKTAVGVLYWAGFCLGWLGLVISQSTVQVGWMLLGFVIAMGIFLGVLLWKAPGHEEKRSAIPAEPGAVDPDELLASNRFREGKQAQE